MNRFYRVDNPAGLTWKQIWQDIQCQKENSGSPFVVNWLDIPFALEIHNLIEGDISLCTNDMICSLINTERLKFNIPIRIQISPTFENQAHWVAESNGIAYKPFETLHLFTGGNVGDGSLTFDPVMMEEGYTPEDFVTFLREIQHDLTKLFFHPERETFYKNWKAVFDGPGAFFEPEEAAYIEDLYHTNGWYKWKGNES